jgi:ATP-binding cassette, subfamily B (MDR/TAP), member 1
MIDSHQEINNERPYVPSLRGIRGSIELRNVRFRYPTRPSVPVLDQFNLKIEPGTHIALVGPSGCGKSTIIQLVERFYDPLEGKVLVSRGFTTLLKV